MRSRRLGGGGLVGCVLALLNLARAPSTAAALRRRAADGTSVGKRIDRAPSVVYGVMTNGHPAYLSNLAAQLETWAEGPVAEGRFFAVAGRGCTALPGTGLIVEDRCPDDWSGLSCKEERLLEEGYKRGADWFMILGDDNYVDTAEVEAALGEGTAVPRVLGIPVCGKSAGYCKEVDELGGLCGGGGYAFNRAALEALLANGTEALRQEFSGQLPGDMASSCAIRRRGIQLEEFPGLGDPNPYLKATEFQLMLTFKSLTFHYVTPAVMRWLHAYVRKRPAFELGVLEEAAFDGGCCCAEGPELQQCRREVLASDDEVDG